jgi:2-dehydrotetronate isomerase
MPKFAANLSMMFTDMPFPDRFRAAASAGFAAAEFLFPYAYPPEQVAGWLKANNLVNPLFNFPAGKWEAGERGITSLPGREEEFRDGVATALRYARELETPKLHAMAGIVPAGGDFNRHRAVFIENVRHAAREAARRNLMVVMEPINHRDIPGYFLNTQAQAHAIREEVGEPNLKVQFDLYHAQIAEGDLAMKLRKYMPEVGHIQIAGVPGRHEPDEEGEVNWPYLFRLIDELGYSGWIGCEYSPRGKTEEGLGWFRKVAPPAASL